MITRTARLAVVGELHERAARHRTAAGRALSDLSDAARFLAELGLLQEARRVTQVAQRAAREIGRVHV